MTYLFLSIGLVLFFAGIRQSKLVPRVLGVVSTTREAMAVVGSSELDEEEKEARVQAAALQMMRAFVVITFWVAVVVAVPLLLLYLGVWLGLYSEQELGDAAINWYFLGASTIVMIVAFKYLK